MQILVKTLACALVVATVAVTIGFAIAYSITFRFAAWGPRILVLDHGVAAVELHRSPLRLDHDPGDERPPQPDAARHRAHPRAAELPALRVLRHRHRAGLRLPALRGAAPLRRPAGHRPQPHRGLARSRRRPGADVPARHAAARHARRPHGVRLLPDPRLGRLRGAASRRRHERPDDRRHHRRPVRRGQQLPARRRPVGAHGDRLRGRARRYRAGSSAWRSGRLRAAGSSAARARRAGEPRFALRRACPGARPSRLAAARRAVRPAAHRRGLLVQPRRATPACPSPASPCTGTRTWRRAPISCACCTPASTSAPRGRREGC